MLLVLIYVINNACMQAPVWQEVGTHIGTVGKSATPVNVPDGFFYIPFLQSLEALLNQPAIIDQVISYVIINFVQLKSM